MACGGPTRPRATCGGLRGPARSCYAGIRGIRSRIYPRRPDILKYIEYHGTRVLADIYNTWIYLTKFITLRGTTEVYTRVRPYLQQLERVYTAADRVE